MLLGVSVTTRKTHRKYISSTRSRSFFLHFFMIIMTMIIMMMMLMIMLMSARVADIIQAIDVVDL